MIHIMMLETTDLDHPVHGKQDCPWTLGLLEHKAFANIYE